MIDNFHFSPVVNMRFCADGISLRYETWRDRWTDAIAETFWPKPEVVVVAIDVENGIITCEARGK